MPALTIKDHHPFKKEASCEPYLKVEWASDDLINCPVEPYYDFICYDRYFYGDGMCSTPFIIYSDAEGEPALYCQVCGSQAYRGIIKSY
jgi:hypothetical protein